MMNRNKDEMKRNIPSSYKERNETFLILFFVFYDKYLDISNAIIPKNVLEGKIKRDWTDTTFRS